jgi:hypothetical protein
LIGFGFAWLIGPGIFRGNCPCGNFKGRYAGRIGRQDITGKKLKDFQFCLPILPAYLPLKLPNGQFPLKIPGPISQTKPKPIKKNLSPSEKKKN